MANSPVKSLVASILAGPTGLQGYLIDPSKHGAAGKTQRRISFALHIILGIMVVTGVLTVTTNRMTQPKDENGVPVGLHKVNQWGRALGTTQLIVYIAMGITVLISIILAIIILAKSK